MEKKNSRVFAEYLQDELHKQRMETGQTYCDKQVMYIPRSMRSVYEEETNCFMQMSDSQKKEQIKDALGIDVITQIEGVTIYIKWV